MAIGNPITLTSNVASKTINVIATASQSLFTVNGGYRINEIAVFRNGVRLVNGRDFTARDGSVVTLLSAASAGDVVEFQVFDTFRVADAITPFDSDQTIAGNLNITGILSASQLGSVNFNVTSGIQTFNDVRVGGALTVAGALTFEDVTNIDSVGIITAQSHVSIADSILHTGDTDTSIRFPAADTFTIETGGTEAFRVASDQKVYFGDFASAGSKAYIEKEVSGDYKLNIHASSSTSQNRIITFNSREDVEALRIDASGRLLVNTDSAMETFGSAALQVATTAGGTLVLGRNDTSVSVDNGLGAIYFDTKAGGSYAESAVIAAEADAAQGSDDYPSRLVFKTTADGASSVTERLRITSAGRVGINSTSPGALFTVNTGGTEDAFRVGSPNGSDTIFRLGSTNTDTDTHAVIKYDKDDNYLSFVVSGESHGAGGVLIANGGNVGISSASPGRLLSVGGDMGLYRSGTQHGTYYIYKDNVAKAWFKYRGDNNVVIIGNNAGDKLTINPSGDLNVAGITTATQLFEGSSRVATAGKAVAMALVFG